MASFLIPLFLLTVAITVSTGQIDTFNYECEVLKRLDLLENELVNVENKFKESTKKLESELKETTVKLQSVENELQVSTEKLEIIENDLKTANGNQSVSNIKLEEAIDTIHSLKNELQDSAATGSTYVRWGRTTCPGNGTELIYAGFAGGSWFEDIGAAVNHICLPRIPLYGKYAEDNEQDGGQVFGAEYKFSLRANSIKFFPELDQSMQLLNKEVPCAVCRTARSMVLMVPAQYNCMDGWTMEYEGMLVSGYQNHKAASEYICLDGKPEFIVGERNTVSNDDKLLFFVEGRCGSLQCPPYVNGRELTCAVCSK